MADLVAALTVMSAWHWFPQLLMFFAFCVLVQGVTVLVSRVYRVIMVLARGWPTALNMDADGDIVHPDLEEKEGATQC